jgi:hypothetical protein
MKAKQKFIVILMISLLFTFQGKCNTFKPGDSSTDTTFIYDDGSAETGFGVNPGFIDWLGNYFPVSQSTTGVLHSFDVYFLNNPNGSNQQLSINVFNSAYVLIGSTPTFTATSGNWISVPSPDIPFSGPFYTMVKWLNVPGVSHYLGLDTNGINAHLDLERYYDGITFQKLSDPEVAGIHKGVFMLRAHASLNPGGITEMGQTEPVMVYPLPAKNYLNIIADEDLTEVKMIDLTGRIILRIPSNNQQSLRIDISGIPDGIYILSVGMKTGISVKKISILHQ